jgi:hypothetical protein
MACVAMPTCGLALAESERYLPSLVDKLARSKSVRRCFATQWYRFALGRVEDTADTLELTALQARFEGSGGAIPDLIVALTTSDAFRTRAP